MKDNGKSSFSINSSLVLTACILILTAFGILLWQYQQEILSQFWISVSSSVVTSLFAVAILTLLVDPVLYQRQQETVDGAIAKTRDELQGISADKIIETLTGDIKIFDEIHQHIIRQHFIIRKFNLYIELEWLNQEKDQMSEFIQRTMSISHQVENISDEKQMYEKVITETLENEDVYPDSTKIVHVKSYKIKDNVSDNQDNGEDYPIDRLVKKQYNHLRLELGEIPLEPQELMGFEQIVKSVNRARDFHTQTIARIADGFEVTIVHPEDLEVNAYLLHPSQNSFEASIINSESKICKKWSFHAGVLPHQGILITWSRKKEKQLLIE